MMGAIARVARRTRTAIEMLVASSLHELPVLDEAGKILGFLDETDIGKAYLVATEKLARAADATPLALS